MLPWSWTLHITNISRFVGEESYSKGASRDYLIDDSPTWCVDPLDGTVNYIHLFPMFCVSIAFIHASRPLIGVINAPFLNQFFSSCAEIYHSSIALEQILLNLLTNAVRYNDKEIGLIKVSIREDEHAVVLEVEDNGNGVRPEFQAKIFEANFVGASADRFSNSGTGIGLSTVKDLITRLEGKIFLESSPGEGSVFIVQLPKYSTQLS